MNEERNNSKKIIFMGTPWISTMALKSLMDLNFEITCVISQPDRISGRKREIIYSPVKKMCIEKNIYLLQPEKIIDCFDELSKMNFDYIITCAYGQFIPDKILNLPKFGAFNIHASILPKYRGGAPIQWSIINGEKETGISFIRMIKKMDAGEIYFSSKIPIDDNDNLDTLTFKLGELIYKTIQNNFLDFTNGLYKPFEQNEDLVSFAYNIQREQEKINWNKESQNILNFVRALYSKPLAYSIYEGLEIKILKIKNSYIKSTEEPGTITKLTKEGIFVSTKDFDVIIEEFKISGKNPTHFKDYFNGNKFFIINNKFI